jgi:hypothetical protein
MEKQFTIFAKDGGGDTKEPLRKFYEEWGWIDFLINVAESNIFIKSGSGLTGLECAKIAKAYEVLVWASKQKEYNLAYSESLKLK